MCQCPMSPAPSCGCPSDPACPVALTLRGLPAALLGGQVCEGPRLRPASSVSPLLRSSTTASRDAVCGRRSAPPFRAGKRQAASSGLGGFRRETRGPLSAPPCRSRASQTRRPRGRQSPRFGFGASPTAGRVLPEAADLLNPQVSACRRARRFSASPAARGAAPDIVSVRPRRDRGPCRVLSVAAPRLSVRRAGRPLPAFSTPGATSSQLQGFRSSVTIVNVNVQVKTSARTRGHRLPTRRSSRPREGLLTALAAEDASEHRPRALPGAAPRRPLPAAASGGHFRRGALWSRAPSPRGAWSERAAFPTSGRLRAAACCLVNRPGRSRTPVSLPTWTRRSREPRVPPGVLVTRPVRVLSLLGRWRAQSRGDRRTERGSRGGGEERDCGSPPSPGLPHPTRRGDPRRPPRPEGGCRCCPRRKRASPVARCLRGGRRSVATVSAARTVGGRGLRSAPAPAGKSRRGCVGPAGRPVRPLVQGSRNELFAVSPWLSCPYPWADGPAEQYLLWGC